MFMFVQENYFHRTNFELLLFSADVFLACASIFWTTAMFVELWNPLTHRAKPKPIYLFVSFFV